MQRSAVTRCLLIKSYFGAGILGHAGGVSGGYGRKGTQTQAQVAAIDALEPPVVKQMRAILMAAKEKADRGEFVTLKPWLTRRTTA
jgi:hypothetical protein